MFLIKNEVQTPPKLMKFGPEQFGSGKFGGWVQKNSGVVYRKIQGLGPEKFGGCVQKNSGVGSGKIRGLRTGKFGVAYRKIRGVCMIIQ